eukprot:71440_1
MVALAIIEIFSWHAPGTTTGRRRAIYFATPNGENCPLWQLTITPSVTDPEKYHAVVFCVSYFIAGGPTSHKLLGILLGGALITCFTVERLYETETIQNNIMGPHFSKWNIIVVSVVGLSRMFVTGRKLERRFFLIHKDEKA